MRFVPLCDPPETGDDDLWFGVRGSHVAVVPADHGFEGDVHYLGTLEGRHCWAVTVADDAEGSFADLRMLWGQLDEVTWTVAGRAIQIAEWDRTHRYCGRCATPTTPSGTVGERARRCPACGLLAFPRLAPAVIVVVSRGDEILLARGLSFPIPMYSAIAGFVEPGETLEEAVQREVLEEVGVHVTDVRYVASQPWPFPHSLMLGFYAAWESGDITVDERELADARWFALDDLPQIPPPMSIARRLIDGWMAGRR